MSIGMLGTLFLLLHGPKSAPRAGGLWREAAFGVGGRAFPSAPAKPKAVPMTIPLQSSDASQAWHKKQKRFPWTLVPRPSGCSQTAPEHLSDAFYSIFAPTEIIFF